MRKKGDENYSFAVQRCDPLDENNDFTLGFDKSNVSVGVILRMSSRANTLKVKAKVFKIAQLRCNPR
jgi:hypothetical protein